jgi:hypothetical protein
MSQQYYMKSTIYFLGLILTIGCTYDSLDSVLVNKEFKGIWTVEQVYANDYWGGPLHWRNTDWGKQIKFTSDHKYYERVSGDFELIGTYKILSGEYLEITWDKPSSAQYPTYEIRYEFDSHGHLTISTGTTEGIVLEKYKLTQGL